MNHLSQKQKPVISIVLGTLDRKHFLKMAIRSIRADLKGIPSEIIVIDGGSTDGSLKWLLRQADILTIVQHNKSQHGHMATRKSWGYFMNLGFKCAQGKFIAMLSDDCLVVPGSFKNAIDCFDEQSKAGKKIGGVAFYWRNWPEQDAYSIKLTLGNNILLNHGFLLRDVLGVVDYIEEDCYSFYHADGDLSLKIAQEGYEIVDSKSSFVEHFAHANEFNRAKNNLNEKLDWHNFSKKWEKIFPPPSEHERIIIYNDPHKTFKKFLYTKSGIAYFIMRPFIEIIKGNQLALNFALKTRDLIMRKLDR